MPNCVFLALCFGHVVKPDAGDFVQMQFDSRNLPTMTFNNEIVFAPDSDWIIKSIVQNGFFDPLNIVRVMLPGIVFVRG